jgi:uncharacterized zinc-type alcohol dehydrogenase-like protein
VTQAVGYAAASKGAPLAPWTFERRAPGPKDVVLDILYCGICHSDIHQVRDEWGGSAFPMVPGHEIAGRVVAVGSAVKAWKVGDLAGVGCFVDSCRACPACREGEEQFCEKGVSFTYNGVEQDKKTPTQGGYSTSIVVDEAYALRLPASIPLERVAPLLCAGITTYAPLKRAGLRPGDAVAVVGLGGLGHMGVKIAKAMGADVTVISHSPKKLEDAKRLGASDFIATSDPDALKKNAGRFRFLLDTVSAPHDVNALLGTLRRGGSMVMVGVPPEAAPVSPFALIVGRRQLGGSMIGGVRETQEMLDFCGKHGLGADVEVIPIDRVNEAYERTVKGDVRYRFVIDLASLKKT